MGQGGFELLPSSLRIFYQFRVDSNRSNIFYLLLFFAGKREREDMVVVHECRNRGEGQTFDTGFEVRRPGELVKCRFSGGGEGEEGVGESAKHT